VVVQRRTVEGFAALNAAPELLLRREQEVLEERGRAATATVHAVTTIGIDMGKLKP
jgi:hypothetical protein